MAELKKAVFADMDEMIGEGILKKKRKPRAKVVKEQYTSLTNLPKRKSKKQLAKEESEKLGLRNLTPEEEAAVEAYEAAQREAEAPTARERAKKLLADAQPKEKKRATPERIARLRKSLLPKPVEAPTTLSPAPVKRGRPVDPNSKRQKALRAMAEKLLTKAKTDLPYEPIVVPDKYEKAATSVLKQRKARKAREGESKAEELPEGGKMLVDKKEKAPRRYK